PETRREGTDLHRQEQAQGRGRAVAGAAPRCAPAVPARRRGRHRARADPARLARPRPPLLRLRPQMIYLDNAATTQVRPEVRAAMDPFLDRDYGNPSSLHAAGRRARRALEDARETAAAVLGADPKE